MFAQFKAQRYLADCILGHLQVELISKYEQYPNGVTCLTDRKLINIKFPVFSCAFTFWLLISNQTDLSYPP